MSIIVLSPMVDLWPYVKSVRGRFCHQGADPIDPVGILVTDQEFTLTEDKWLDLHTKWVLTTWSNVGPHVMVRSRLGFLLLHFVIARVHTKAGVVLKNPNDIAMYFDPNHNRLLEVERQRQRERLR